MKDMEEPRFLSARAAMRDRGARRGFKGLVRRAEEGQRGVAIIPCWCNAPVLSAACPPSRSQALQGHVGSDATDRTARRRE
jgi:hypothetical protein